MLSSLEIREAVGRSEIMISPFELESLRSSSYLLRISDDIFVENSDDSVIDTKKTNLTGFYYSEKIYEDGYILLPMKIYLISSFEYISLSDSYSGMLSGLSSFSRAGLMINMGSNLVSSTFGLMAKSRLTFEIINMSAKGIKIYPFVKMCHIVFFKHEKPTHITYSGIYDNADLPVPSNFFIRPSR
jgi:dCTP deaminase